MNELLSRSATQIAKAIREGEVSSEEITRSALERIDEVNPKLNAVVMLAADRAMDEARSADARTARGESMGRPSTRCMTSPTLSPALSAGPPGWSAGGYALPDAWTGEPNGVRYNSKIDGRIDG